MFILQGKSSQEIQDIGADKVPCFTSSMSYIGYDHYFNVKFTGACAAVIDIGTSWMFDLKEGVCIEAFWLNREQCCWAVNDTAFDEDSCTQVFLLVTSASACKYLSQLMILSK